MWQKSLFLALLAGVLNLCVNAVLPAQSISDPHLTVQPYISGLDNPTAAVFMNANVALIGQKNDGKVLLVRNGQVIGTALDLPVANDSERGLLGIALSPTFKTDRRVFVYHTVADSDGGVAKSNTVTRYIWNGSQLVFDKHLISFPVLPGPNHDGGKIAFDPQGNLLIVTGDLNRTGRTQNFENSSVLDRTSSIIRINQNGGRVASNPFARPPTAKRTPLDDIFAYGIRNSFGIETDPVTGVLWDTENGPDKFDEINRVTPGFNSGWKDITGPRSRNGGSTGTLVSLGPKAAYSDPEFSWAKPVAPTDLHFFKGKQLGTAYQDDMFVGDFNTGSIYHFNLNKNRTALSLSGPLADLVADNTGNLSDEQQSILFGSGFGGISDLLDGPGGLYALSIGQGTLYRIGASGASPSAIGQAHLVPEPKSGLLTGALAAAVLFARKRTEKKQIPSIA